MLYKWLVAFIGRVFNGLARPCHRFFSDKPRLAVGPKADKFTNIAAT